MMSGNHGDKILMGRMLAGMDLLGRSGVESVNLSYEDDLPEPVQVQWRCEGDWGGVHKTSERFPYPAQAVDDLLARVINGGLCTRCNRHILIGVEVNDFCCFMLEADDLDDEHTYRYVRTCESRTGRGGGKSGLRAATPTEVPE